MGPLDHDVNVTLRPARVGAATNGPALLATPSGQ